MTKQTQGGSKKGRFKDVKLLVADYDQNIRMLIKQVLENFGFRDITIVRNGEEARRALMRQPVDLLISEWVMEPMGGIELLDFIRLSKDSPCRDLPVIFLTGKAEEHDVIFARNKGVTEFVVKPFTASTLSHRIIQVVDNPRSFVMSKNFVGPDRRRGRANPDKECNRINPEEMSKTAKYLGDKVIYEVQGERVVISNPNENLKKMIGGDVSAEFILDEEVVKAAQEVILAKASEFAGWVRIDLKSLDEAYRLLEKSPNDRGILDDIAGTALTVKSQSGMFGYDLATQVAKTFYNFLSLRPEVNDIGLLVIRKHIDLLFVIFHQEITGSGEKIGEEALDMLNALIKKAS